MTNNLNFIPLPSPAQSSRLRFVTLHHTAGNLESSKITLAGTNAAVSAHYLVDTNGDIYSLVPEDKKSWHAGISSWGKYYDINVCSVGIEIVNLNGNVYPYPDAQIQSIINLCLDIKARHSTVEQKSFLGHSDVAPTRKIDPGVLFPWKRLYENGIGMWYDDSDVAVFQTQIPSDILSAVNSNLRKIGYDMQNARAALTAFRSHFNPTEANAPGVTSNDFAISSALIQKWY